MAACFDVSRDTFRQKKFREYKIQRPPMPDGLSSQISLIKEVVSAYGIAILEKQGYEADDIIATLAKKARQEGMASTIISSDKDMLQLVDEDIAVFSPHKDEDILYDRQRVFARFAVNPEQIPDLIALMGDGVDNIPGAKGIGEKTAVELIKNFGSLKNLLANTESVKQPNLKNIIKDNIENIKLSKELAILDDNIDLDFDLGKLKISQPNLKELFRLFKHLEFKRFLSGLPYAEEEASDLKIDKISSPDFKRLIKENDELFIYGLHPADLLFYAQGRFFSVAELNAVKDVLSDPQVKKIGHDLKKIKASLAAAGIALEGLHFDIMVAAYLINSSKPEYGLADLALDYLDEPLGKTKTDNLKGLSWLVKLKPRLEKELYDKALFKLFTELEMPLVEVLADMEFAGIKLDLKVLSELSQDLERRLIKLIENIYELSGCQFNINSPKQLRGILFEKLKLPVIKKSKTGPSTDEEVLRKLADRHQLPKLLLEYRQLTKLKSTYIDALPELIDPKTGSVHTCFNQTGTETGRLSSSNPNLQNIPVKTDIGRKIRLAIIATGKDDYLLSCDYSQIELRILAHLSQDENLIAAFKEDKDIHRITASLIYGLAENDIDDNMRNVAKRVNFGIVYGLTSYGLSRDLNIPQDQAQMFIEQYFLRYPKVKDYIAAQINKAQKEGFVTTILGRRRYIPEINNKNQAIRQFAERRAVNTPIQGSASDLIKLAMVKIHHDIKEKRINSKMILQIHDELLFNVPEKELIDFCSLVKERMEKVLKLDVPIKVDIKKGKNWLEMEEIK